MTKLQYKPSIVAHEAQEAPKLFHALGVGYSSITLVLLAEPDEETTLDISMLKVGGISHKHREILDEVRWSLNC